MWVLKHWQKNFKQEAGKNTPKLYVFNHAVMLITRLYFVFKNDIEILLQKYAYFEILWPSF